ncbi:MAG: cytochrome c oxidase assembly protein [Rhodospirillales bacterium]|jgi:putative membrane protein|nr:cytochrome c oxidase assembly protein [Rhodospirillales bacterium]
MTASLSLGTANRSHAWGVTGPRCAWAVPFALVVVGAALDLASTEAPAAMPVFLPFDFSWFAWLGTVLPVWWFLRGNALLPADERPPPWRQAAFLLGMAAIWAVLQTRYLYLAEHEFFFNRIQHVVMHHLGPFLVALGLAGDPIRRGMPRRIAGVVTHRLIRRAIAPLQQPFVAAFLFVGLVALWLIPPVHFRAMISDRLFWIMNWSMVLDGLLFWCMVLDPRPAPPARAGYGARAAMAVGVIFPQILIGALIVFARYDIYPYYDFCGRFFPTISPRYDQLVGGMVVWIPPAMMSVIALILVLNHLRRAEESAPRPLDPRAARMEALSARWTGRPDARTNQTTTRDDLP